MPEITRQQVVDEALTWVGTPYQHHQSCKGVGADCVGLCLGVFKALGCIAPGWFPQPYAQQWHIHRNEEQLVQTVESFGFAPHYGEPRPGDMLFFQYGRVCSHTGLYVGGGNVVHAFFSMNRAVLQPVAGELQSRARKVLVAPWIKD